MTQSNPDALEEEARRARIAAHNDALRKGEIHDPNKCSVMITQGVSARGLPFLLAVVDAVKRFDAFTPDNDPYRERDFGAVEIEDEKIFWKIDAYDRSLRFGSPDPADPEVTHRVLTIMLAGEY